MSLEIIGAGFGRTGTASLKYALERLGFGPCYHMSEVIGTAGHIGLWLDVADGRPDWPAIFRRYRSTVDFPACSYWRELADFYPDAKLVLSVRDAERWLASTQETIFSRRIREIVAGTPWGEMLAKTTYGQVADDVNDRDAVLAAFHRHNEAVRAAFGPDRLLVYEVKQGWEPLCAFLEVAVPDEPFPRVNSTAEFDGVFEMLGTPLGQRMMDGLGGEAGPSVHDELFRRTS